ncbi:Graves disease carrier protein [Halotydeus destructor]|nr:Graves disease carrier protein [Halotydeus destructor]
MASQTTPMDLVKSFTAGGIAGMVSKTTIAPLDRIKILLQGHNAHYKNFGVISGMGQVVKKEGFLGLYKGNGAMMVRIFPYAAVQFVSFDMYKKGLSPYFKKDSHLFKLLAGSLAGINSVIFTYPLDLVRARLAFVVDPVAKVTAAGTVQVKAAPKPGVVSTIVSIAKNEGGMSGLYRGLTPTLCHIVPYAGLNFYSFEKVKATMLESRPDIFGDRKGDQVQLNVPSKLLAGGLAGSIGQTVAYPLDVTRRRMQLSFMTEETKKFSQGIVYVLKTTYKEHGVVKGLYRGMTANYIRAAPMMAVNFCIYELMKQMLGIQTGVEIKSG